jgi:hypothetical protein
MVLPSPAILCPMLRPQHCLGNIERPKDVFLKRGIGIQSQTSDQPPGHRILPGGLHLALTMAKNPFPGLQVVHRSASLTSPRNLPGICVTTTSASTRTLPLRSGCRLHSQSAATCYRASQGLVLARPSGPPICRAFFVGPASPTNLSCWCIATRTEILSHMPALCYYSRHRKDGTTHHHHHHRLSSHPVHVEGYARYRCYVPPRSFPREQHPSRARGIRRSDSRPCNLGKYSTIRRGRARITRDGYEAKQAESPAAGSKLAAAEA